MMAEFRAALTPPRTAKEPPVKKPAITVIVSTNPFRVDSSSSPHTGVVRILLLPDALDRAVESREHTTPHTKVTTENGRAGLDGCDGTYPSLAVGAVSETFDTVPDGTTDRLGQSVLGRGRMGQETRVKTYTHAESTTEVAQGNPGTGISGVIHCDCEESRRREMTRNREERSVIRRDSPMKRGWTDSRREKKGRTVQGNTGECLERMGVDGGRGPGRESKGSATTKFRQSFSVAPENVT